MYPNYYGIKARPVDLDKMLLHNPSIVEMHCSMSDLEWMPEHKYEPQLAVHVPEYTEDGILLDPASTDEESRKLAEKIYLHALGRAKAWGLIWGGDKPRIVFHPGGGTPIMRDGIPQEERYVALGKTIEAMKEAADGKVEILLENLPRSCCFFSGQWKANIVTGGAELAMLGRRYGINVTLDLCHLYMACLEDGLDFLSEVKAALPMTRHVHYSDAAITDEEGLEIGEGTLPIAEAFELMSGMSDIYAIPEIWFGHENGGEKFVTAWRAMDRILEAKVVTHG